MPYRALTPCVHPGCGTLVAPGHDSRCPAHPLPRPFTDGRRWYFTARWRRLRGYILAASAHVCARCGHVFLDLDVDHIQPHGGDPALFWNPANLQALCHSCHAAKTKAEGMQADGNTSIDPGGHFG